jgi:hypothetical protein
MKRRMKKQKNKQSDQIQKTIGEIKVSKKIDGGEKTNQSPLPTE